MDVDDIDDDITVKLESNEEGSMEGSNGDSDDDDEEGILPPPFLPPPPPAEEETSLPPRTKNEILASEVPLEELPVAVEETAELIVVGQVRSIVGDTVIVQSAANATPVDHGSLLCCAGVAGATDDSIPTENAETDANEEMEEMEETEEIEATEATDATDATEATKATDNTNTGGVTLAKHVNAVVLGKVDEIFGPVAAPLYVVRMEPQRAERLREQLALVQQTTGESSKVYAVASLFKYVSLARVNRKGSDASNVYDEEPNVDEITDFSDDEAEATAKRKKRKKKPTNKKERKIWQRGGKQRGDNVKRNNQQVPQVPQAAIPSLMSTGPQHQPFGYGAPPPQLGYQMQRPQYHGGQMQQPMQSMQHMQHMQHMQQRPHMQHMPHLQHMPHMQHMQHMPHMPHMQQMHQYNPNAPPPPPQYQQQPMGPVPSLGGSASSSSSSSSLPSNPPPLIDRRFQGM